MSSESVVNSVPDFPNFCLNTPLYSLFTFNEIDLPKLKDVYYFNKHLDCYCLECNQPSVFTPEKHHDVYGIIYDLLANKQNEVIHRHFFCSRDRSHELIFYFRIHNGTISKIGQNPSIADLATYDIRKYIEVLGKERYAEFSYDALLSI
jgi:hypothetical protein